jgi:hypothetical protein
VNLRVSCPLSKFLSEEPENNPATTPQSNKSHIRHDWWDISILDGPWCDEFGEAVSPDIFVDRDSNEDATCDWFVRIDCIGRGNGWKSGYLNTSASVTYHYYDLEAVSRVLNV